MIWYKDLKRIKEGDGYRFEKDDQLYTLVIEKSKIADSDTYKCVAKNPAGDVKATAKLTVKELLVAPEFTSTEEVTIDLVEGNDLVIEVRWIAC